MRNGERTIANPLVVLREEFDDWAVLFDPDTGHGFGLNPTGVYVWKLLDGEHTINDMLKALGGDAHDVPQEAGEHLAAFVEELTAQGLAGYDVEPAHDDRGHLPLCPTCTGTMAFAYEPPKLILGGQQTTLTSSHDLACKFSQLIDLTAGKLSADNGAPLSFAFALQLVTLIVPGLSSFDRTSLPR